MGLVRAVAGRCGEAAERLEAQVVDAGGGVGGGADEHGALDEGADFGDAFQRRGDYADVAAGGLELELAHEVEEVVVPGRVAYVREDVAVVGELERALVDRLVDRAQGLVEA